MTSAQQWLEEHQEQITDYQLFVNRLRSGEKIECVVILGNGYELAIAEFSSREWSDLFDLSANKGQDLLRFVGEHNFIEFCAKNRLVFAQKDFLNDTRRLLEIARNASEFKSITVPLNTVEDIDALLALIDGSEQG